MSHPRFRLSATRSALLLTLFALPACSSSSSPSKAGADAGGTGDAQPTTDGEVDSGAEYLGLKKPANGIQLRSLGTTIPAGKDLEFCEVAQLPGKPEDVYYVNRIELANGKGSHHLIVSAARPGTPTEAKIARMNIGDRVPCVAAEASFGTDFDSLGGIQHPYGDAKYPDGIARKFHGGQYVIFDYHYYNASESDVHTQSAFNLYLTEEAKVKQLAGGFGFFNWTIDTPPQQKGRFVADCRFQNDALVAGLARHTHQWGRDFTAWFAGGARDGEKIWTTPNYETQTDYGFDEPVLVKAGEGFKFECNYDNTESYPLRFGVKATDEMCILFGSIWDPTGKLEPPKEDCDVTYIGPDGVGLPAEAEGAFPPSSQQAKDLCLGGSGAADDPCTQCACSSCAEALIKCSTDADCLPIMNCRPPTDCEPVLEEHHSGVGMAQQVGMCIQARCSDVCGAKDAGTTDAGN